MAQTGPNSHHGVRSVLRAVPYILLGGSSFWGADALFLLASGLVPMRVWLVAKSLLLPLAVIIAARAITRKKSSGCTPSTISYLMLAGIWLLGPLYSLLVNQVFYATGMKLGEAVFTVVLFPLSTVVFATYSGALGGLVISSVFLALSGLFALPGK